VTLFPKGRGRKKKHCYYTQRAKIGSHARRTHARCSFYCSYSSYSCYSCYYRPYNNCNDYYGHSYNIELVKEEPQCLFNKH
jgi:hypothetical protein